VVESTLFLLRGLGFKSYVCRDKENWRIVAYCHSRV